MPTPPQQAPIGYWLKRADALLTAKIDAAQQQNGLSRLDWQALNVVREETPATADAVARALRPFADAATITATLDDLAQRGVVVGDRHRGYTLTDEGEALYQRALAAQRTIRVAAVAGLSEADYKATIAVLERLVANLEAL